MTDKERLNEVLNAISDKYGISERKVIAQKIGVESTYFSGIAGNSKKISRKLLEKLQSVFNVNPQYIKNGIGEMFKQPEVHNTISNTGAFSTNTINGDLGQQLSELISVQKGMQQDYLNLMQEKDRQIKELIEIIKQDKCNGKQ
jgi:hypothetical protein